MTTVREIKEELGYDGHTVCLTSGWGDSKRDREKMVLK
jgi:hypothetical protein